MGEWWQTSNRELLTALSRTQHQLNADYRNMLELVAEVAARKLSGDHGYITDIELLRCTQNISPTDARRRLSAAADVLPGRTGTGEQLPAPLPATAIALAEHAISADHVAVVQQIMAGLKPHLEIHRRELESYLAENARVFDPPALRILGKRRLAFLDPDGAKPKENSPTRNKLSLLDDGDGVDVRGWFDRESAAILRTALSPLCAPKPADDGTPDPRTPAERTADGLIDLARRTLDDGGLPTERGERPHITITVPLDTLHGGQTNGLLDFADGNLAGAVSAEDARRWACDAQITRIVLGPDGQPLDIGRTTRVVPRHIRRALHQRDHGCAFPGCTAAPQWTDAHHILHWGRGGATALHNLVLLCGRHHTAIHKGEWTVTLTDGFPLFHPPPWIPGGPRTNTMHRIDLPDRSGSSPPTAA